MQSGHGPDRPTDLETALAICAARHDSPAELLEILLDVRGALGALSDPVLRVIAGALNLSRAEVAGVASFYPDLADANGRRIVRICLGEACRALGSGALFHEVEALLGSGNVAVAQPVYCLGNCALSPAVMVDGKIHGRLGDVEQVRLLAMGAGP